MRPTCQSICAVLLTLVLVSSCGTLPSVVDPQFTWARFHADRQQRLARFQYWQVAGILEVSTDQGRRRYRTKIQGQGIQRAKVTLFGFMHQVAGMLFAGPEEIRLVDPETHQIIEVPASAAGLDHLIGIALQPEKLLESIIGLADPLKEARVGLPNGWLTQRGEQLVLDPNSGLIQERFGRGEAGSSYQVLYRWRPIGEELPLSMPAQVRVTLLPSGTQVKYTARQWRLLDEPWSAHWFSPPELEAGFAVQRPFQGGQLPE